MKLLRSLPILVFFFITSNILAQDPPVPNQYMIYFATGTTPAEVQAIANDYNSIVLVNLQAGTNLVLFEHDGIFPMPDPNDPTKSINSLIEAVGHIVEHEPGGDGGSLNYHVGGTIIGNMGSNCYDQSLLLAEAGTSEVKVAVFDTGTNWEDANENGFDFQNVLEMNGDATDGHGHGTHVASIANSTYINSNNGSGAPLKYVFGNPLNNPDATGTLAGVAFSMEESIKRGTNLINGSFTYWAKTLYFGGSAAGPIPNGWQRGEEDILYLLMASADPVKTLFIVAAGNNSNNLDAQSNYNNYPAAFPLENMITVASHSCINNVSTFSNFGAISVDLAAPGENIVSIDHKMDLVAFSGTSQATAAVTGAASIVASHLPYFDAAKVKCALMTSAKYTPAFEGKTVTEGILDIPEAVAVINGLGCGQGQGLRKGNASIVDHLVTISPMPFTSDISIAFDLEIGGEVNIEVYSTSGQLLTSLSRVGNIGSNEVSINFDNLSINQCMFLRIETNEFTKTSKIFRVQ